MATRENVRACIIYKDEIIHGGEHINSSSLRPIIGNRELINLLPFLLAAGAARFIRAHARDARTSAAPARTHPISIYIYIYLTPTRSWLFMYFHRFLRCWRMSCSRDINFARGLLRFFSSAHTLNFSPCL